VASERNQFCGGERPRCPRGSDTFVRTYIFFACVDNVEIKPNQVRLGEHSDFGTITLVFQLDSEGLQVGFVCYK